jgi:hypothetical protein
MVEGFTYDRLCADTVRLVRSAGLGCALRVKIVTSLPMGFRQRDELPVLYSRYFCTISDYDSDRHPVFL